VEQSAIESATRFGVDNIFPRIFKFRMNIARLAARQYGRVASHTTRINNKGKAQMPDVEFLLSQRSMKNQVKTPEYTVNKFSNFMVVKYYI